MTARDVLWLVGLIVLALAGGARADVIITETGTTFIAKVSGVGSVSSLIGQPYTLTTDFDPASFSLISPSACGNTGPCYQSNANSGTTTLTVGGFSATVPNNVSTFLDLGPQPVTGLNGIQVGTTGFGGTSLSMILDPASPVPNPFTLSGTFSTAVDAHQYTSTPTGFSTQGDFVSVVNETIGPYALSGFQGTVTNLTITNQPAPTCSSVLQNAVQHAAAGAPSATNQPTDMLAAFTPQIAGMSLSQAATDCGYTNFNWQQTLTNLPGQNSPATNPFYPLIAPTLDPPPGGPPFARYCSAKTNIPGTKVTFSDPSAFANANPFYWNNSGPATDCMTRAAHQVAYSALCNQSQPLTESPDSATALCFFDSPVDAKLPPNTALAFTTCLVGVDSNGKPVALDSSLNDCFKWTDSYTGFLDYTSCTEDSASQTCNIVPDGGGGILANSIPSGSAGMGEGGITLVSDVPEPPSILLFILAITLMSLFRRIGTHDGRELPTQATAYARCCYARYCSSQAENSTAT